MINKKEVQLIRQLFREEKSRNFPDKALQIIYQHQLFRLFIPKELKGLELSLPEALKLMEDCARADGDFGWAVQIGAGGGFFAGFMPENSVRKYFSDPHFVIAGSGFPAGTAEPNRRHYLLNGSWKYCSGSTYASLFTFSAKLSQADGIRAFAILPEQVKIHRDWRAYGMRNTLSHSVSVEDQQVKAEMSFDFRAVQNDFGYKLYYFPFMAYAKACILSTLVGCFRHLMDEIQGHLSNSKASPEKLKMLDNLLAASRDEDENLNRSFFDKASTCWESLQPEAAIPAEDLQAFYTSMGQYLRFINMKAYELFSSLGLSATMEDSAINKVWRDLTTAAQHMLLK